MALALMMKSYSDGVVKHIGEDCERPKETTRSAISFHYTRVKERISQLPRHYQEPDGSVHHQGEG